MQTEWSNRSSAAQHWTMFQIGKKKERLCYFKKLSIAFPFLKVLITKAQFFLICNNWHNIAFLLRPSYKSLWHIHVHINTTKHHLHQCQCLNNLIKFCFKREILNLNHINLDVIYCFILSIISRLPWNVFCFDLAR